MIKNSFFPAINFEDIDHRYHTVFSSVFYANLGSAEIFFANRKRGPQNKWQINILKHTSVPNVGIVDILNGFSVSTCK